MALNMLPALGAGIAGAVLVAGATSGGGAAADIADMLLTTADPTQAAVAVPAVFELGAVVAGAISGALAGCDKKLDILGVCVLALLTALGGGLVRDMILPTDSIYMLDTPLAVVLTTLVGIAAFFFSGLFYKLDRPIAVFDIISVALFTFSGADKALMLGYGIIPCVLMGVITGVGGGMVRDICMGRIPKIFQSSNYYAVCSLAGAVVYYVLVELHLVKVAAAMACVIVVVGLRWLSLRFNLITAVPVDLTPKVMGPFRQLIYHLRRASAQVPNGEKDGELSKKSEAGIEGANEEDANEKNTYTNGTNANDDPSESTPANSPDSPGPVTPATPTIPSTPKPRA